MTQSHCIHNVSLKRFCRDCALIKRSPDYLGASARVAEARVRYATSFLRFKAKGDSDGTAHQRAIVDTGDELTVLLAEQRVAELEMAKGTAITDEVGGSNANQRHPA